MLLFAQMGNVRKEIFLKGEKRTDDIISCVRSGRFYKITFKSHKTYTYNYFDVKIIEPSKEELFIDNRLDYFKSIADKIGLEHTTGKGLKPLLPASARTSPSASPAAQSLRPAEVRCCCRCPHSPIAI